MRWYDRGTLEITTALYVFWCSVSRAEDSAIPESRSEDMVVMSRRTIDLPSSTYGAKHIQCLNTCRISRAAPRALPIGQ